MQSIVPAFRSFSARVLAISALLLAIVTMCRPFDSHAEETHVLKKIALQEGTANFTPVKKNDDGSFSVAITACFLGRCPIEGDVCCHGVHPMAGNVYWCCRGGQQCVAFNGCR